MPHRPDTDPRPRSAVTTGVGLAGIVGLVAWTAFAWFYGLDGPFAAMLSVVACGVPMLLWSLLVDRVHRAPTSGIDWDRPLRPLRETAGVSITKLAGLWTTWGQFSARLPDPSTMLETAPSYKRSATEKACPRLVSLRKLTVRRFTEPGGRSKTGRRRRS